MWKIKLALTAGINLTAYLKKECINTAQLKAEKFLFMDFIVVEMDQYNAQKEAGTEM